VACISTLFATIARNDVIIRAKLDALYTHLAVMRGQDDEIDKRAYLELFDACDTTAAAIKLDLKGPLFC
jgi:hypothetical protein